MAQLDLAATGAASGALWETLIGLLFPTPLLGAIVGASAGAVGGALADIGVVEALHRDYLAGPTGTTTSS